MLGFNTFAGPWVISADHLVNEINQGPCYVKKNVRQFHQGQEGPLFFVGSFGG